MIQVSSSFKPESTWAVLNNVGSLSSEEATNSISKAMEASADKTATVIHERGGLAKLAGMPMVPSQFLGPSLHQATAVLDRVIGQMPNTLIQKIERIEMTGSKGEVVKGVILYPHGWDGSNGKCVVYNNPNGVTVSEFLSDGLDPESTPGIVLKKSGCPMIMYDYVGTGISRTPKGRNIFSRLKTFLEMPSAHTIARDGRTVLTYALKRFRQAEVWGSSLGGGVATVACESYLAQHPKEAWRVSLYNHDSFTTTGRVVLPRFLTPLATLVGGNLNAERAMKRLIKRHVRVVVLCHQCDPVIPKGARMAEVMPRGRDHVRLIMSPYYGHANLSPDMVRQLGND